MFSRLHKFFSHQPVPSPSRQQGKKATVPANRYVLVLSGGGTRGFYTLGVLKAIEEAGLKGKVDAIYGVSVGAIIACYWASGRSAQEIFTHATSLPIFTKKWVNFFPKSYLLETKVLEEYFKADLPEKLETLSIKTFIGATDLYSAKLILFSKGMLLPPLLGSMALPGIFPSVPYQHFLLNDGGIVDNFPTAIAQQAYPEHKIIGIALNKFIEQQQPKNLIQTLIITFEIMMRKDLIQGIKEIAIAFYEKIDCGILELDKKKRKKAFEQGYASGVKKFKAL